MWFCSLVALCLSASPTAPAARESLADHDSVRTLVFLANKTAAAELGIKKEALLNFAIKRLQDGRVPATLDKGRMLLTIEINMLKTDGLFVFNATVAAAQGVRLMVGEREAFGETWRVGQFGAIRRDEARIMREVIGDLLDQFAKDWHAVHQPATDPFLDPPAAKDKPVPKPR